MMRKSIEKPDHPTQSVTTNSVRGKDFESTGQINIITSGTHNLMDTELDLLGANKFASIVDMNQLTNFPINTHRKRNKNDFYRFLLNQNFNHGDGGPQNIKINNDILIPRSILKKNDNAPDKVDDLRENDDLEDLNDLEFEDIGSNEAVIGKKLEI